MAVWITEYSNALYYGRGTPTAVPADTGLGGAASTVITTTVLSSAATSTMILSTNTRLVRLTCDQPCWPLFSGSSLSTSIATTTNAGRVPPNLVEYRSVVPGSRLTVLST